MLYEPAAEESAAEMDNAGGLRGEPVDVVRGRNGFPIASRL